MTYLSLIMLLGMVIPIVDIASAEEADIRGLSRNVWVLVVLLLPLAGAIAWLVAGRPIDSRPPRRTPEYAKPDRFVPQDSDAESEFLRQCRERAEAQRRAAELRPQHDDTGSQ